MRPRLLLLPALLLGLGGPALAQTASAPAAATETDQAVLMRGILDATRANTQALQKAQVALETLANRLERVEAAARNVPPAVESARTDIVAIRAILDRLANSPGARRPAVTLRFGAFACANESEASCAANACRSVGYQNGLSITATRSGTGANVRPVAVSEATCYD